MKWAPLAASLLMACPKPSAPDEALHTAAANPAGERGVVGRSARRGPPAALLPPPNPACVGEPAAESATLAPGDRVVFPLGWTLTWTAWRADEGAAHLSLHDGATELQLTVSSPMPQLVPVLTGCWRVLIVDERALQVEIKPARPDASGL